MNEPMGVLVTGGAGFIGSHITHRLVSLGHRVTVIDNKSSGLRSNVPEEVRYIRGDVTNPADLDRAFEETPDAVIHIAGQVSIIRAFSNPVGDPRTNVEGGERASAVRGARGEASSLRQLDERLRQRRGRADAGGDALLPSVLLRRDEVCGRALRASDRGAARPAGRPRRHLLPHVQRPRTAAGGGQSLSGGAGHLPGEHHPRGADPHLRRRQADPRFRLHQRRGGRLDRRARQPGQPLEDLQSRQRAADQHQRAGGPRAGGAGAHAGGPSRALPSRTSGRATQRAGGCFLRRGGARLGAALGPAQKAA